MNWIKLWPIYFLISGLALSLSLFAIFNWGLRPAIDFTGGSVVEYSLSQEVTKDDIAKKVEGLGYDVKEASRLEEKKVQLRFSPDLSQADAASISALLSERFAIESELLRFETVGPAFSQEVLEKTYIAIVAASLGILLWVAWQFKSFKFGVSAILAMLHDTGILLGTFAILGHYQSIEVDVLFVTAVLTTLSFSVHDTIVVYDRIRESSGRFPAASFGALANKAVSETMVRSVNNSLTIIFMLFALFLMGGTTIRWFVFALLVGTIAGTYSSPFVAVPLLVAWDKLAEKVKRNFSIS